MERKTWLGWLIIFTLSLAPVVAAEQGEPWPPQLEGAKNGTVTLTTEAFLNVPAAVAEDVKKEGAAPFVVAKTPPTVDLAFHGPLYGRAAWSSWGDICVASDRMVYCGIGDHGDDAGGKSHTYVYRWDPKVKVLKQVVDMNEVVPPQPGQPTWAKIHSRIDEGPDGGIYFSCVLNDGEKATQPQYKWTETLPGGQLYRYDPKTGKTTVVGNLPPARCTVASLLDRKHNLWWCILLGPMPKKPPPFALFAIDLATGEPHYQSADGTVYGNNNFALASDGSIFFYGQGGIWKYDPRAKGIAPTGAAFTWPQPKTYLPGMRSSTRESKDGYIYGVTWQPGQIFRLETATNEVKMLGPEFLLGSYTAACVLSPDERFLYYVPGAHGRLPQYGTPVVQYEIATGQRKVIAFLAAAFKEAYDYVPLGSYGMKISADGSTLYVNFNNDKWNLTSFLAVRIPESER